ncbi:MAG: NAD(P)-dependent oxidoreductase [Gaiellales bacterium]
MVADTKRILVTGVTGKVGQTFVARFLGLEDARFGEFIVRGLCHNRPLEAGPRVEVVMGSIEDEEVVGRAMDGVTHVLHLATSKETPQSIMDVAVKGLFWLLEACRTSPTFQQFILVGGDAGVGHSVYPHPIPVTETQRHTAYPGCYALSKVLEEVMLEQYGIQYDLAGCCLRAPWIMEKDDFRYVLSFGEDVFGGPRWRDLVGHEQADAYVASRTVPIMLDGDGRPLKRNFVHVEDVVDAILAAIDSPAAHRQTFNICMDEPVDYGELGAYLAESRGLPSIGIRTAHHSTWLDNTKAKFLLGWRPRYTMRTLTDAAWDYRRRPDDPRVVWYPG